VIGVDDRESAIRISEIDDVRQMDFRLQVCTNEISFAMAADDKNIAGRET
jgi:hypothetical protein